MPALLLDTFQIHYLLQYYHLYQLLLHSTKGIKPGNMVDADLYSALKDYGTGEYALSFIISSYDVDTQETCNGATQTVYITVK